MLLALFLISLVEEAKKLAEEEVKKSESEQNAKAAREKLRAAIGGRTRGLAFTFEEPSYNLNKPIPMTLSMHAPQCRADPLTEGGTKKVSGLTPVLDLEALGIPLLIGAASSKTLTEEQESWQANFVIENEYSLFDNEGKFTSAC